CQLQGHDVSESISPVLKGERHRQAAPGGETHVRPTMAQEGPRQSAACAGNLDDGVWLRSVPVRAVAEATGLSHLNFRLPHRQGRQGVLRTGLWPASEASQ